MSPNEYQVRTAETEIYTDASIAFLDRFAVENGVLELITSREHQIDMLSMMYCAGKLNGEAGELAELVFKAFRGGAIEPDKLLLMKKELGDVLWYVARIADLCGFRLEDVMEDNLTKLRDRKERGQLHGYGDER